MPLAPFTKGDINKLTGQAVRAVKRAAGLPVSTNSLAVTAPQGWGLGLGTLEARYALQLVQQVRDCINSPDPTLRDPMLEEIKMLSMEMGYDDWLFHHNM